MIGKIKDGFLKMTRNPFYNFLMIVLICAGIILSIDSAFSCDDDVFDAEVVSITDGDTIRANIDLGVNMFTNVKHSLLNQRIRLYGIDTPEIRTSDKAEKRNGIAAKEFLIQQLHNRNLKVKLFNKGGLFFRDNFHRLIVVLFADDININISMIESGHAVPAYQTEGPL